MPNFSTALSGLNASAQALSVIANNLANLNTVGYKDQRVTFQDMFYQNIGSNGGGEPLQVGAGTTIGSISSAFTSGSIDNTGVPTDVAINGDGFFVTRRNEGDVFTRGGNFTIDKAGELTTQNGDPVLGYPVVNGVVATSQALSPIQLGKGQLNAPSATTRFQLRTNLNSNATVGESYSTPLTVYDSLGNSHILSVTFTKTAPNTWNYSLEMPANEVGAAGTVAVVRSGSVTFDANGKLQTPAANVTGINIPNLADGAAAMSLNWTLFDSTGSPMISQTAAPSSTASTNQDGYSSGTLQSFSIGDDGLVQGTFSNGRSMAVGQLALANFADVQGLLRTGGNDFLPTLASGAAVIGIPGSGGRGTLTGGALELSNADIAQEFSKMIINQRGYQANAKVVTTFDEITQDTINLKR